MDDHRLGVAPIGVEAGEAGLTAEVFHPPLAELADAAGPVEPGHSHPLTNGEPADPLSDRVHNPHDLMAGNDGKFGQWEVPLYGMQVRVADAAGLDAQADFLCARLREREVRHLQRRFLCRAR
jgi:hypothetical protein